MAKKVGLKIFHRALVLVLVPLAFQILFVCSLYIMLHQVEQEKGREQHARQVADKFNLVIDSVLQSSKVIASALLLGGHSAESRYSHIRDRLVQDIAELKTLLVNDRDGLKLMDSFEPIVQKAITQLDDGMKLVGEGDRLGAISRVKNLRPLYDDLSAALDKAKIQLDLTIAESPKRQARDRQIIRQIIIGALVGNVLLAIFLAWLFNRSTTSRLSVLVDNTHRLAKGRELNPAVEGADEIAQLDETFREMAQNLKLAYETERKIIESMPVGVAMVNREGIIETVNPTLSRMFEYAPEEFATRPLQELVSPSKSESADKALAKLFESANGKVLEAESQRKGGQHLWVALSLKKLRAKDGERLLAVFIDITERKQIEQLKQDFVSMVSHDLRTPITSIRFFVDLVEREAFGSISKELHNDAEKTGNSIDRLNNLINDILDIDKMESGNFTLSSKIIKGIDFIDPAVESMRGYAASKKVRILLGTQEDASLEGDSERLERVMTNLLDNAIKVSPPGSFVRVSYDRLPGALIVKVSDQGPGVPAALRNVIFDRFKPVDAQPGSGEKSTGLGLAICRALIDLHGGRIGLESEEGKGSTFWFELPTSSIAPNIA
jgi:PAS domain S-box-containing protein